MTRTVGRRYRRRVKFEQHVRLHHWVLNTEAYMSLSLAARAVLIELMRRYNGFNNGRIALSVRDAARACRVSKNTAARALRELVAKGFIIQTRASGFNVKCRLAAEWALTEFRNDASAEPPSKAFMRWPENPCVVHPFPARVAR